MISERLILRSYRPADAEVICQAIEESRPSLARWVPDIARRRSPSEVRAGLELLARGRDQALVLGLWHRLSRQFLGELGLYRIDRNRRIAEVGYWLRQTARGHGFVGEGMELLSAHSRELGVQRLEAHIATDNLASRRVAERHGFQVVGHRSPVADWDGDVDEVLIYARAIAPRPGSTQRDGALPVRVPRRRQGADDRLVHRRGLPV